MQDPNYPTVAKQTIGFATATAAIGAVATYLTSRSAGKAALAAVVGGLVGAVGGQIWAYKRRADVPFDPSMASLQIMHAAPFLDKAIEQPLRAAGHTQLADRLNKLMQDSGAHYMAMRQGLPLTPANPLTLPPMADPQNPTAEELYARYQPITRERVAADLGETYLLMQPSPEKNALRDLMQHLGVGTAVPRQQSGIGRFF